MAEGSPSFQCILEDTQKYIGWLPEEVQSLKRIEIEREVSGLKNLLEEKEKKCSELQKKIIELDMKSSSSRDAHKMYGDIRPGDTTHQDVMMAYKNFHSNAPRNLLKELPAEADKFKIWEVFSDIVQESFKKNKDDIIRKIKDKLHEVLLEDIAKPLDEETTDLIRAFSMFTDESVRLESVKQLLKEDHCDHNAIERAAKIIKRKLNPKHFSSSSQEECISESRVTVHGTRKDNESFDSQYHQIDEKEKRKAFWRSKSSSEIETYASAGRNNIKKSSSNKKKSEPKIDTETVYQKLKEKMTKAIEILELLEEMESIKKKLIRIEEEIKTMKKRVDDEAASMPMYTLESKHKDPLENKIILKLIEAFIHDLESILTCTSDEYIDGGSDTREKYKIYGLVLSACGLKKSEPPDSLKHKVLANFKEKYQIDERIYEKYVQKAVAITRDMLTLLPPLIITVHRKNYDERLHDIKRPAWDESGERQKLTYYRPILVFGNELHVAVKGSVGNIKRT